MQAILLGILVKCKAVNCQVAKCQVIGSRLYHQHCDWFIPS